MDETLELVPQHLPHKNDETTMKRRQNNAELKSYWWYLWPEISQAVFILVAWNSMGVIYGFESHGPDSWLEILQAVFMAISKTTLTIIF